jgi:4'-phosphopantetheinyl transferase
MSKGTDRRPGCVALADRYFAPAEAADIAGLPRVQQRDRFLRYWTLKEAYIKATGRGLSQALDAFAFELLPEHAPQIHFADGSSSAGWRFAEVACSSKHLVSVAVEWDEPAGGPLRVIGREVVPFAEGPVLTGSWSGGHRIAAWR